MPEVVEWLTRVANAAVRKAQEENRRKGIPNVYSINGKIVWQLPDGTITDKEPPFEKPGIGSGVQNGRVHGL